ncbi:uncharacterized protein LOC133292261 [Gastrolobium bilobum]|uniref:uncharacterized protein LOC133292261 n=1 Tax=Gastrolobium bilobum TaxID=150636 RepID=UPI002AB2AB42|nr:uncharacterized protein LOC133292261 [Gastrolobium bilobum]
MGANVQCNGYFPGYYSTRDLIFDSEGSIWTSSNVNSELRNDCYHMVSMPVSSSPCNLLGYNKELLKQTILKHEAIFRDQIHELHRVYHKQRELMDEIKRNESYNHNLRLEASRSSSAQQICCSPNFPWSIAQSSVLIAESVQLPLASAEEKRRQICPAPAHASTVTEESLKDSKLLESKYRKVGKKILDLQLPADEYIDSEECEENERVTVVAQVSAYSLNGISQVVSDSHEKPYGTNSKGYTDLNVPFKLKEEAAAKPYDLGPPTHHRNNPFYDLSRRTELGSQNFPNDVIQHLNKRQDLEACSHNPLPYHEKKHEWLSSRNSTGHSGGLSDCFPKVVYTDKQSVSVDSLSKNMEQFNDIPYFHSLYQINRGPWTERKFSSSESSTQTQGCTSSGLLEPNSASRRCALYQNVSGADMIGSEISPAELWKTPVSDFGQSLLAVQASSASLGQSSKSLMGISGFTTGDLYQCTSVKSGPNLDGQNYLLSSSLCNRSKLLDLPSISTNDPNNCDNLGSSHSHELRKFVKGSEDVGTPKNLNLNIMPAGYSDTTALQSFQITGEENKFQDSTRGLPWLKEKLKGKGKPNEVSKISTQIESVFLNPYNTEGIHCLKLKKIEERNLSTEKTLAFHSNGKAHMSTDPESFQVFPSEVFQNQSKNQRIEEIEKGSISDVKSPCIHAPDLAEQIPAVEHLMKNEQKKHESFAGIIDLNSRMIEDENMPVDVDFRAPVSPENKECSPPRGESDENQLEMPCQLVEQEDPEVREEKIRIAAEALVSISGLVARKDLQMTTCSSSDSFVSSPLHWFAGIVSTTVDHPENEIKANDLEELLPAGIDYFEFMTLKLTETKVLDCCYKSMGQTEQVGGSTSPTQPRKCRANRGRWRKDFQREILPSLASLSRYEVTEDLHTIGGLVAAGTRSETGSLRTAGRNVLGRGKRRSCASTSNITDLLLNLKKLTSITEVGIERRGLISWGKTCRKRRGQRFPTTNPKFILSPSI